MKKTTKGKKPLSARLLRALTVGAAGFTALSVLAILAYALIKGVPNLNAGLFSLKYTSDNASMLPALVNTLTVTACTLLLAVPLGVAGAIWLAEYAPRGSKLVSAVRLTAETLAGVPSIVFGLFGYLLFNVTFKLSYTLLSGVLTLTVMVLPTILRTTEEALLSVPDLWREGSFGLGAGRLRTVGRIVLPAAMPGILSGVVLAVGRIVGETAALIFTAGTATGIASLMTSGRTLSVHMYALLSEGLYMDQANAVAPVLLALVIGLNALSRRAERKLRNERHG